VSCPCIISICKHLLQAHTSTTIPALSVQMQKLSQQSVDYVVVMHLLLAECISADTSAIFNMAAYSLILFLMHVVIGSNCM